MGCYVNPKGWVVPALISPLLACSLVDCRDSVLLLAACECEQRSELRISFKSMSHVPQLPDVDVIYDHGCFRADAQYV
jgi:hypothetical protein